MRISREEQAAIRRVVEAGAAFGFGNMISHLHAAWAKSLRDNHNIPDDIKREGYPIAMHEDLMLRGFWDETGKSYSTKAIEGVAKDIGS